MLYKFKSKATGDLIMLEPHGRQILGLIGKTAEPKGIVEVAELPAAIDALQAAVALHEARHAQAQDLDEQRAQQHRVLRQLGADFVDREVAALQEWIPSARWSDRRRRAWHRVGRAL